MNDILIRCENLTKTYGSGASATHALRGITLAIPRGSFTCIVGPSGHGKSTLMHLIGGLDRPSGGTVHLDETHLGALDHRGLAHLRATKIGFVFQFFNLLRNLTALENIETAMLFAGQNKAGSKERALELLARVGLADRWNARPGELSGGQQQRVAIARALANDPDLLLLDEPTGNLDSAAEAEILQLLQQLHGLGRTVVLVTHNPAISALAQTVIEVRDGRIAA